MNLPIVCTACNDEGWLFFAVTQRMATMTGTQETLTEVPYGTNLHIPANALIMQPCNCAVGQKFVSEVEK